MSEVEFDGDEHAQSILYAKLLQQSSDVPSLINWLTKTGIAKSPEGANRILIVVMVFSFMLTGYTAYRSFVPENTNREKTAELREISNSNLPPIKRIN